MVLGSSVLVLIESITFCAAGLLRAISCPA
jgi:hypothetical protein